MQIYKKIHIESEVNKIIYFMINFSKLNISFTNRHIAYNFGII